MHLHKFSKLNSFLFLFSGNSYYSYEFFIIYGGRLFQNDVSKFQDYNI